MASSSSSSSTKVTITMRLVIDTVNQKVLYAVASKPAIDFLLTLLDMPIGTVTRLLNENSLGNLHRSLQNLETNKAKSILIKPENLPLEIADLLSNILKPEDLPSEIAALVSAKDEGIPLPDLFMCRESCSNTVTCHNAALCPDCGGPMNIKLDYVGNKVVEEIKLPNLFMCRESCSEAVTCDNNTPCPECKETMILKVDYVGKKVLDVQGSGLVKEVETNFIVMDDLVVEPESNISTITLLKKFNVKDVGALQEKVVELGMAESIEILKASLQSKMVLTSVFLKKEDFTGEWENL